MTHCECDKELSKQSDHSPSTVADGEILVYALINPLNVTNEDGTIKVAAFSKSGLKRGDLSVCRASLITGADAKAKTVDIIVAKQPGRSDSGYLVAKCGDVRAIKLGETAVRAICVNDDGLEDFQAHAHLAYSNPQEEKMRNHREAARAELTTLFQVNGVSVNWDGPPFASAAG
jgi:hypothetical protein